MKRPKLDNIIIVISVSVIVAVALYGSLTAPQRARARYSGLVQRACGQATRNPDVCTMAQFEAVQAGYTVTVKDGQWVTK